MSVNVKEYKWISSRTRNEVRKQVTDEEWKPTVVKQDRCDNPMVVASVWKCSLKCWRKIISGPWDIAHVVVEVILVNCLINIIFESKY